MIKKIRSEVKTVSEEAKSMMIADDIRKGGRCIGTA